MINYSEYQLSHLFHNDDELHHLDTFNHYISNPFAATNYSWDMDEHSSDGQTIEFKYELQYDYVEPLQSVDPLPLPLEEEKEIIPDSSSEVKSSDREKKCRNETKNILKNFGKGIISFLQKNEKKIRILLRSERVSFSYFISMMREEKRSINTISDLRRLWTDQTYGKCMMIISNLFFRRNALDYIFNSRIHNYSSHIKYRQTLWQALRNPTQFNRIKEF